MILQSGTSNRTHKVLESWVVKEAPNHSTQILAHFSTLLHYFTLNNCLMGHSITLSELETTEKFGDKFPVIRINNGGVTKQF